MLEALPKRCVGALKFGHLALQSIDLCEQRIHAAGVA